MLLLTQDHLSDKIRHPPTYNSTKYEDTDVRFQAESCHRPFPIPPLRRYLAARRAQVYLVVLFGGAHTRLVKPKIFVSTSTDSICPVCSPTQGTTCPSRAYLACGTNQSVKKAVHDLGPSRALAHSRSTKDAALAPSPLGNETVE